MPRLLALSEEGYETPRVKPGQVTARPLYFFIMHYTFSATFRAVYDRAATRYAAGGSTASSAGLPALRASRFFASFSSFAFFFAISR